MAAYHWTMFSDVSRWTTLALKDKIESLWLLNTDIKEIHTHIRRIQPLVTFKIYNREKNIVIAVDVSAPWWYYSYRYTTGSRAPPLSWHPSRTLLNKDSDKLQLPIIHSVQKFTVRKFRGLFKAYLVKPHFSQDKSSEQNRNSVRIAAVNHYQNKLHNLHNRAALSNLGVSKKVSIFENFENTTYHGSRCSHWTTGACSTLEKSQKQHLFSCSKTAQLHSKMIYRPNSKLDFIYVPLIQQLQFHLFVQWVHRGPVSKNRI